MHKQLWAGVDVGGHRKGYHVAVVGDRGLVAGPERITIASDVIGWLSQHQPAVVALDSPRSYAAAGETRREAERLFAAARICGIRWTPDEERVRGNDYYGWIVNGRRLYDQLEDTAGEWTVIEVFPTASFTIWAGPRAGGRAVWTRKALTALGLSGFPKRRLNQDDRDAVAAAVTARLFSQGGTRSFADELVVPTGAHGYPTAV